MIEIKNLTIKYQDTLYEKQNIIIQDQSLTLLIGESGCGKTSLLYYIGLLSKHHEGVFIFDDICINELKDYEKAIIRRNQIGYVFQEYMLLDHFSIYDQLQYYSTMVGKSLSKQEAFDLLNKVRLKIELDRKLYTLSGGEKQRLAIACAICKNPRLLLLDEPTSALDEENTKMIFDILNELKKERMIIVSSHNKKIRDYADEIIEIKNKEIHKIKEKKCEQRIHPLKNKVSLLTYRFYKNYIHQFKNNNKYQISLLRFVIAITLMLSLLTLNITNHLMMNTKNMINDDNLGQIFIKYDKDIEEQLFQNQHIYSIYKYYDLSIQINQQQYPLIPYYKETNLKQKIWTNFNQKEEMYLSYELYNDVSSLIVPNSCFDYIIENNQKQIEKSLEYSGILVKGLEGIYIDDCTKFVYIPYEIIETISDDMEISGYNVFLNDYDSLVELYNELKDKGYDVNIQFQQFETLQDYIQLLESLKILICLVIIIISSILLNYVYQSYFQKRKKEFALLKSNGLLDKELVILMMIEFFNELGKIVFLMILFIGLLCMINYLNFIENIILLLLNSFLMIIILLFMLVIKIRKINPEKIFRDSK